MSSQLDQLVEGNHNIPIAIVDVSSLPVGGTLPMGAFKDDNGIVHHKSDKANLFVEEKDFKDFEGVYKKITHVQTAEDFAEMKQRLLSLPTVLGVMVSGLKNRYVRIVPYMIYINSSHPDIKWQLEAELAKCKELVTSGGNFSFDINVGGLIRYCFAKKDRYTEYSVSGGTICITNFSRRYRICYQPWMWVFPITWILAPPYMCYRAKVCRDIRYYLKGKVVLLRKDDVLVPRTT